MTGARPSGLERARRRHSLPRGERRKRFGLLLVAIAAAFIVQGVSQPGRWQQVIVTTLLAITLVAAVRVAEARSPIVRGAVLVSSLLVALSLIEALAGNGNGKVTSVTNLLLVTLAPPAILLGIIRTMRARGGVTIEAVFGVLCLYLLLGMFFAVLYGAIDRISGSFFSQGVAGTSSQCLYFSFTTLTTVGYGDLTASSNLGHTLAVCEALLGQVYLVTVVGLIVGNLRPRGNLAEDMSGPLASDPTPPTRT